MGRIIAIDYGLKRCGVAVTDTLKLSVNPLGVFHSKDLFEEVKNFCAQEDVETIVLGKSVKYDGTDNSIMNSIRALEKRLRKSLPKIEITYQDEFGSSKEAVQLMVNLGVKKKKRRQKENIDLLSASIILQRYLENQKL